MVDEWYEAFLILAGCGKSTPSTEVDVFENAKPFGFRENRAVRFIGWRGEVVFPHPPRASMGLGYKRAGVHRMPSDEPLR